MTELFRYMVLRAPEDADTSRTVSLDSVGQSALMGELTQAANGPAPERDMSRIAQLFVSQDAGFVRSADSLNYGEKLSTIADQFRNLPAGEGAQNSLASLVHRLFPKLTQLTTDKGFLDDKRRVRDSIVALQLSRLPQGSTGKLLVNLARVVDLLERAAADENSLKAPGALADAATRIVVLPSALFPTPALGQAEDTTPTSVGDPSSVAAADRLAQLKAALLAINNMIAANTDTTDASQPMGASPAGHLSEPAMRTQGSASESSGTLPLATVASVTASDLQAATYQLFAPPVQAVLMDLHIDLSKTPLKEAGAKLAGVIAGLDDQDAFHEPGPPLEAADGPPKILTDPPTSHGTVAPAGIADLLVVREHVLRYEAGEIAFVENVAAGESLKRQTLRKNTTENSTLTTNLVVSQTERDLQTTDRFGLQAQSQAAVADDSTPGAGVSSAYGPLVDSGGSTNPSPQASTFGQDVMRRAVAKLITSTETQVFQQTITEFDETVEHDFDNHAGAAPNIIVYQWLDKIVQAKVFSYGKRMLYDFVIPEPAVFLAFARAKWQPELAALRKPILFPLEPRDLSPDPKNASYQAWAVGYGATNIQPPPEPKITLARAYGDKGANPQGNSGDVLFTGITAKETIDIPQGYQAMTAIVYIEGQGADNMFVDVVVGEHLFEFTPGGAALNPVALGNHEVGQIPITVMAWNAGLYTVSVEITCQPTAQYIAQWQSQTHDTILQASRDRMAEYEDQLRALTADLQVKFAGKSSDEKQALIRAELEKGCVTILSNQHFEALNAIDYTSPGPSGFPQLFLPNVSAVGRYVRFFQQAFEWDQMLYRYYPYFWGRKKYWNDRLQLDDQDAEFAAFLSAGAARVTVPVRKGYETAVATYMTNGTIPSAADVLSVASGLYVPFFLETMGADGGPDQAVAYGNPLLEWELRIPTTLVKVRTNNTLPRWKQSVDAQNHVTYVPDPPGDPVTP